MGLHPAAVGAIAGGVALAATTAGTAIAYAQKAGASDDPDRGADFLAGVGTTLGTLAGAAAVAGAVYLGVKGKASAPIVAVLGGVGAGVALGTWGGLGIHKVTRGTSVNRFADNILRDYDHNKNRKLDLKNSRRRQVESVRVDADGTVFTINNLANASRGTDNTVTRSELRAFVAAEADTNKNGRLSWNEQREFNHEYGEVPVRD